MPRETEARIIDLVGGGRLELDPAFFAPEAARELFLRLEREVAWGRSSIRMFGREVEEPRLTAWYGDPEAAYAYSGRLNVPRPWTPALAELRSLVEARTGARFNGVLANLYRDGRDSMGLHADAEPELGPHPVIASLSFGAPRDFVLVPKKKSSLAHPLEETGQNAMKMRFVLGPGSLLVMSGATQANWKHGVPKQLRVTEARINLTFRLITEGRASSA